jgi:hypothetical protein
LRQQARHLRARFVGPPSQGKPAVISPLVGGGLLSPRLVVGCGV